MSFRSMQMMEFGINSKRSSARQRKKQKEEWKKLSKKKTEPVSHNGRLIISRKNSVIGE